MEMRNTQLHLAFVGGWALSNLLFCEVVFYLFEIHVRDVLTYSVALFPHECYGVKASFSCRFCCHL